MVRLLYFCRSPPRKVLCMARFTRIRTHDIRFPTSRELDGSDAMNPSPDYSAAYLVIETDAADGLEGHGFAFTTGRGNDIQTAAISGLASWVEGEDVEKVLADLGGFARRLTGDAQLRWLGPEKGVAHMAVSALLNALWDLRAKRAGLPLWQLLARMSPQELVDNVDFRYISDAITREEALELLSAALPERAAREADLIAHGFPAYTTSPGWLGYDDEKMIRLARAAVAEGFDLIKLKVGGALEEDIRRLSTIRSVLGDELRVAVDANQRWDVAEAIDWMGPLLPFAPYWIEEPTSPDDILGHAAVRRAIAPVKVAAGEQVQNRVIFKQLLQAEAIDVVQIDACRVGGVNENLAILLLAAKFGVPVCPHAGGVGLCEMVRHLSMFDFVALNGTRENRWIEYIDHLHEHFVDPAVVVDGAYRAPILPGYSTEMFAASISDYGFPGGSVWNGHQPILEAHA
jgi:L-fuconate dehydratase